MWGTNKRHRASNQNDVIIALADNHVISDASTVEALALGWFYASAGTRPKMAR